jgi:hypothetical protein
MVFTILNIQVNHLVSVLVNIGIKKTVKYKKINIFLLKI